MNTKVPNVSHATKCLLFTVGWKHPIPTPPTDRPGTIRGRYKAPMTQPTYWAITYTTASIGNVYPKAKNMYVTHGFKCAPEIRAVANTMIANVAALHHGVGESDPKI
jgi:hypothetical protein